MSSTALSNLVNVRYYGPNDPYHYSVDNRPLTDLNTNIVTVAGLLDNLSSGFTSSLQTSGYQEFSGGLILQWLRVFSTIGASTEFLWPKPFPSTLFGAVATDTGTGAYRYGVGSGTTTGATLYAEGGTVGSPASAFVVAIGF